MLVVAAWQKTSRKNDGASSSENVTAFCRLFRVPKRPGMLRVGLCPLFRRS